MTKRQFNQYLAEADFQGLFITEMGWNNPKGTTLISVMAVDGTDYDFRVVAERNGFQVLTCEVDTIPTAAICKKLDTRLRPSAEAYICIYTAREGLHHKWVAPVQKVEKRDIVTIEYRELAQAEFLFSKVADLTFDLDEQTTIIDVKQRVQGAFLVNSEKITKDFYAGFKKEHTAFVRFIHGIDDQLTDKDNKQKQWYASVMLNRLMFCYFIQKKGFLDQNENYLREKLLWVQQEQGEDRFFQSFYRGFLVHLFHQGLNAHNHDEAFRLRYGRIPYLNGGMFEPHELERMFQDIDIDDEAFVRLFDFFDRWRWHLDTRMTASGRDINPDVLGYIFEQYINDRAAMGAYYTKEDITEYIAKNCILPFLFDAMKRTSSEKDFRKGGYVWQTLQRGGERYIYDAVKHGHTPDWAQRLPDYIACGLDVEKPDLLTRRRRWNERTPEPFALPTEIWRETVERLQRCDTLLHKIGHGEVTEVNDLITLNLDIRQLAYDLLAQTADHRFVLHFYHAMQRITILDPTCGSGAFLFAALNILEPLYEVCIVRMEEFHWQNANFFRDELDEINRKYRSNIQYFIYKSIILRNLYGVDIMAEAVEIAKLRLFLKMVAVVDVNPREDNLGLDPLPDIDFNIRCGNTLVGYATEHELERDLVEGDMFAAQEFKEKIDLQMDAVARIYSQFKHLQLTSQEEHDAFQASKQKLKERLAALNDLLNRKMYASTVSGGSLTYDQWLCSHQPFHWLAEFYQIIKGNGGFDVIIGNPPYVSMEEISYLKNTKQFSCSDLYGYVIKRVMSILSSKGTHGFIVMHNLAFSRNFNDIRNLLLKHTGTKWFSFYGRIPAGLFDGNVRVRNCILLLNQNGDEFYTTRFHRWFSTQRTELFPLLNYVPFKGENRVPMLADFKLQKLFEGNAVFMIVDRTNGLPIYFKQSAYNNLSISSVEPPCYDKDGQLCQQSMLGIYKVSRTYYKYAVLLFSGKLYMSKWLTYGDDFHLTLRELQSRFPFDKLSKEDKRALDELYTLFSKGLKDTLRFKLNAGKNVGSFNTAKLWNITDKSDLIFLKYVTENPIIYKELVENHLAHCILTDKGEV